AAIDRRIGVHRLAIVAGSRNADAVSFPRHGREIAHDENIRSGIAMAQPGNHAVFGVVTDEPLEAGALAIPLVECRLPAIGAIEVGDELLDAAVGRLFDLMPVEALP